jgi:nucleoside-diphosphate-sugar epimerase
MRVLITGATSFIGKSLIKKLVELYPDNHYIGICNHLPNTEEIKDIDLIYADLSSNEASSAIRKLKPDLVYHLAALSSPNYIGINRLWEVNVNGTLNLLNGIQCPIIFTSTANIYGEMPHLEEQLTTFYAASKKTGENLIETFVRQELIPAGRSVRLCGVVGPGMTHGLLPSIIDRVKNGTKTFSMLKNTRKTYIHIDDVVEFLTNYLTIPISGYAAFTLSNKDSLTTTEVTELIYKHFREQGEPIITYSGQSYIGDIEYSQPKSDINVLHYPTSKEAILQALGTY